MHYMKGQLNTTKLLLHFLGMAIYGAGLIRSMRMACQKKVLKTKQFRKNLMLNTWTEQVRNQITYFNGAQTPYPFFVSPFFDQYIIKKGRPKSLTNQFYPSLEENHTHGNYDPIGDINNNQADKVIHRYKNRVLITPTTICPVNCRYCFRKNTLANSDDSFKGQWHKTLEYIDDHSEIEEVIFTGGDPLMISNQKLDNYLNDLSNISH